MKSYSKCHLSLAGVEDGVLKSLNGQNWFFFLWVLMKWRCFFWILLGSIFGFIRASTGHLKQYRKAMGRFFLRNRSMYQPCLSRIATKKNHPCGIIKSFHMRQNKFWKMNSCLNWWNSAENFNIRLKYLNFSLSDSYEQMF